MSKIFRFLYIGVDKTIRFLFIVCCAFVISIPLLVILFVIISVYVHEYHSLCGATSKYFTAMKEGNGPNAVYWAEKTIKYAKKEKRRHEDDYKEEWLGYAFELNGQYEEALRVYQEPGKELMLTNLNVARVQYKLGQTKEAFQGYCQHANDCLVKYKEPLKDERWNYRINALLRIRCEFTMEQDGLNMRLSPFLEYKDFLDFMEEEYAKLGKPPEHVAAMELFEAIARKIPLNTNPPDMDAELEVKREQILAERKEKGVKW